MECFLIIWAKESMYKVNRIGPSTKLIDILLDWWNATFFPKFPQCLLYYLCEFGSFTMELTFLVLLSAFLEGQQS